MNKRNHYEGYWEGLLRFNKMNKYSEQAIAYMRERMAESEWEGLNDRDIRLILMEGCVGWNNIDDDEVVAQYEAIYGEEDSE